MADEKSPSLMRDLLVAIIPLFFGVFLFAGLLESYKNDISSRKDLVMDLYRPMRDAQAECRTTHNHLFLKYFAQAGTYKLMLDEFDHMATAAPNTLTRDYEALPSSIIEANSKVSTEVDDLKTKVEACTSTLYRKYEEVALATGTFDRFIDIENHHATGINALYEKRTAISNEITNKVKVESILDTLRQTLNSNQDTPEARKYVSSKMHEMGGDHLITYFTNLAQIEQDIFKAEQDTDTQLISLFAQEVSRRYKRGLLAALWPW